MTASTDPQLANSVVGVIVYVIGGLLVIAILGGVNWARNTNAKIATQDTALALIIRQVDPPGQPSLRDLLAGVNTDAKLSAQRLDDHIKAHP